MKKNGFTLIELLGVIVILSIVMLIAVPNITAVLDKSKKQNYITDAKTLITQAEYEIRNSNIEKPTSSQILKITLSYIGTSDIEKDSDGNSYSLTDSYVIIVRKDGYLEYYVNLVATTSSGNKGIRLVHSDELDQSDKLSKVTTNITAPTDDEIRTITGITSGEIITY